MIIADKKGFDRDSTLEVLTRITSTDIIEVMTNEVLIRSLMREKYGYTQTKKRKKNHECPKEVKEKAKKEIKEVWEKKDKKKVQTLINFKAVLRKEK